MTRSTNTGTQAVDRAAHLVATVVRADEALTFSALERESGLPKSTTSRLLSALERAELLERDEAGCYGAGPLFWLYAARHDPWEHLVRVAQPTLRSVGAATGEAVHLAVARGDRVVQVAQVASKYLLGARDWTNVDVPTHCSALGKVLLAYDAVVLPDGPLEQTTPRTITDRARLRRALANVVQRGWASTTDELEIGLTAVAVPVHGRTGEVVAALGISGPNQRLEQRHEEIGHLLIDRAGQILSLLRRRTRMEGVA
jgi:DNA-binding IclR family transcriptional regulator